MITTEYTEYDDKYSAINAAHVLSHQLGLPAYAYEGRHSWIISEHKPTLRYGKVIMCSNGKELQS